MEDHDQPDDLRALMRQIDDLLEESYALKRTRESWPRHVEIQAEIMRLCRQAADLHSRPDPYWMDKGGAADNDESKAA
jgi:hypothetical protein